MIKTTQGLFLILSLRNMHYLSFWSRWLSRKTQSLPSPTTKQKLQLNYKAVIIKDLLEIRGAETQNGLAPHPHVELNQDRASAAEAPAQGASARPYQLESCGAQQRDLPDHFS